MLYKWKRNTFLSHPNEKGGPLKHSKGNLSRGGRTRRHLTAISISLNFKELGEPSSCHPAHSCAKSQTQPCGITLPVRQGGHSPALRAQVSRSSWLPPPSYPHLPPRLHQLLLAAIPPTTLLLPSFHLQIKTYIFELKFCNSSTFFRLVPGFRKSPPSVVSPLPHALELPLLAFLPPIITFTLF